MRGKEAGATGWIVKPFNPEQLLATDRARRCNDEVSAWRNEHGEQIQLNDRRHVAGVTFTPEVRWRTCSGLCEAQMESAFRESDRAVDALVQAFTCSRRHYPFGGRAHGKFTAQSSRRRSRRISEQQIASDIEADGLRRDGLSVLRQADATPRPRALQPVDARALRLRSGAGARAEAMAAALNTLRRLVSHRRRASDLISWLMLDRPQLASESRGAQVSELAGLTDGVEIELVLKKTHPDGKFAHGFRDRYIARIAAAIVQNTKIRATRRTLAMPCRDFTTSSAVRLRPVSRSDGAPTEVDSV